MHAASQENPLEYKLDPVTSLVKLSCGFLYHRVNTKVHITTHRLQCEMAPFSLTSAPVPLPFTLLSGHTGLSHIHEAIQAHAHLRAFAHAAPSAYKALVPTSVSLASFMSYFRIPFPNKDFSSHLVEYFTLLSVPNLSYLLSQLCFLHLAFITISHAIILYPVYQLSLPVERNCYEDIDF